MGKKSADTMEFDNPVAGDDDDPTGGDDGGGGGSVSCRAGMPAFPNPRMWRSLLPPEGCARLGAAPANSRSGAGIRVAMCS